MKIFTSDVFLSSGTVMSRPPILSLPDAQRDQVDVMRGDIGSVVYDLLVQCECSGSG